ncbi:Zinc/iron permease [Bombardia bombarda]|uniref:Zinc/iron permease n=1 Tax=Bombardia bombarda TaxID=252184 RepID=A0AA39WV73_9PEZI|nr:Zinc/iron permease [Bombardia bombarda]
MGTLSLPAQWRKEGVELLHAGSVDATQETHVQFSYDQQRLGKRLSKRSTCPVNTPIPEAIYNTPLHAGALVIILAVSSSACAFPMLAKRVPGIRLPAVFFFSVRHFGTGVLIATAFVHLLPTAFILLGDKCLDSFWTTDYPAMPGAIALGGIFLVTIIEMVFHPARHVPSEAVGRVREGGGSSAGERRGSVASAQEVRMNGDVEPEMTMTMTQIRSTTGNNNSDSTVVADDDINNGGIAVRPMGQVLGRSTSMGRRLSHLRCQDPDGLNQVQQQHTQTLNKHLSSSQASLGAIPSRDDSAVEQEENAGTWVPNALTAEQKHRKELLQCVLLEVGILFHSVFIGMALSVSIRGEFIVLLIAIAFHQTFEGLALGSRIASIEWPKGSWQPWLMALAYGCTTPIGQALGLATHSLYSPDSETGLILVGTMNAISSGLLTFASLVELLSEDFLSDESWRILRGRKRIYACLLVFAGAVFMSLVGAWA